MHEVAASVGDGFAPTPDPEPETPADQASDPIADAIASAVAEAAALTEGQASAPSGPPMTLGEKDALRVAVKQCWNVGALSTDALRVTVTVLVEMQQNGRPAFSAPELRDKVVQALGHVRRDRATAEWTVGCFAHV